MFCLQLALQFVIQEVKPTGLAAFPNVLCGAKGGASALNRINRQVCPFYGFFFTQKAI